MWETCKKILVGVQKHFSAQPVYLEYLLGQSIVCEEEKECSGHFVHRGPEKKRKKEEERETAKKCTVGALYPLFQI